MGQMKKIYEQNEQFRMIDDYEYQYEQWMEEKNIAEMQYEAEMSAYQEMLGDIK
jgi:hypothetical protein